LCGGRANGAARCFTCDKGIAIRAEHIGWQCAVYIALANNDLLYFTAAIGNNLFNLTK
jgi:hypothetical protein